MIKLTFEEEQAIKSYGKHYITDDDVVAVTRALAGDSLARGKHVREFERQCAEYLGVEDVVALNSGTSALYAAILALIREEPETIINVPANTFVATYNAAYLATKQAGKGKVKVVDVDEQGRMWWFTEKPSNLDVTMFYAGIPNTLHRRKSSVNTVVDACHAFGARHDWQNETASCFSFHPVKTITTGEGGLVAGNWVLCNAVREIRDNGRFEGKMIEPSHNLWMSDINAALGISQLQRIDETLAHRRKICKFYQDYFCDYEHVRFLPMNVEESARHLAVVLLRDDCSDNMSTSFAELLKVAGIGFVKQYVPLTYHFIEEFPDVAQAELFHKRAFSIPCHRGLSLNAAEYVAEVIQQFEETYR